MNANTIAITVPAILPINPISYSLVRTISVFDFEDEISPTSSHRSSGCRRHSNRNHNHCPDESLLDEKNITLLYLTLSENYPDPKVGG